MVHAQSTVMTSAFVTAKPVVGVVVPGGRKVDYVCNHNECLVVHFMPATCGNWVCAGMMDSAAPRWLSSLSSVE